MTAGLGVLAFMTATAKPVGAVWGVQFAASNQLVDCEPFQLPTCACLTDGAVSAARAVPASHDLRRRDRRAT